MRIAIIVNKQRYVAQLDKLLLDEIAAKHELSYDLIVIDPADISARVSQILTQPYNGLMIGGGDGTVRTVVQELVGSHMPIAVLALGSFNYFARELGFPADIDSLFGLIKNNKTKLVDVGQVNDFIFLNHSSVGFYSRIMKLRKNHPQLLSKNRLLKIIFTAFNFFQNIPYYKLTLKLENTEIAHRTCFLMVGNNYHSTDMFNVGPPVSFSMGLLEVVVLACQNRWELFKCFFITLLFGNDRNRYIAKYVTDELTISSNAKKIDVVMDGDLFQIDFPLRYSINRKKLTVFIP